MEKQPITFIVNGKTFRVRADSLEALRLIPSADREQLIELLEAVKLQHQHSAAAVERAAFIGKNPSPVAPVASVTSVTTAAVTPVLQASATQAAQPQAAARPEKLGKGDVDDLMTRLIMEERSKQKPPLQPKTVYVWVGGFFLVVSLLMMIF